MPLKIILADTYESANGDERKEFKRLIDFVKKTKSVEDIVVYSYDALPEAARISLRHEFR